MKDEFLFDDREILRAARDALVASLQEAVPGPLLVPFVVTTVASLFVDVAAASSQMRDLIKVINRELAAAGLELRRRAS